MGEYKAHTLRMRQTICDAMVTLLEEKPFTKVTVQDILQRAEIQRATFYRYFEDKYEVAEAINHILADHLTRHAFAALYLRSVLPEEAQLAFNAKYHRILHQLLHLRIENVDLSQNLVDTFCRTYKIHFPTCSEYECYIAGRNFLSTVTWFCDRDASISEIRDTLFSNELSHWMARYHHIEPQALLDFIAQQRTVREEAPLLS